ncbi:hypothetical protein VTO73DRAFT_3538 [Trametes versicolor]
MTFGTLAPGSRPHLVATVYALSNLCTRDKKRKHGTAAVSLKKCQKADWPRHIFVCKLDRPIPTAYYLSQACREGLPPVHSQTREDFGFAKAESLLPASVQGDLLRMWTVVYDFAKVSDRDIQAWQAKGALVEGIKTTLTRLPKSDLRDACYAWFLDHLDLLDGSPVDKAQANEFGTRSFEEATRTAWIKAGGSPDDDFKTIRVKIKALPCHVQECHDFYALVAHRVHPRPEFSSWLVFGFVAGMDREDEYWIGRWYARLVNRCTFDAFAAAYQTSSLIKLGEEHEVNLPCPLSSYAKSFFRDVMTASPREFKTVWYLKQYIDQLRVVDPSEPPVLANRGTRADYGFANCRDALEQKLLDELYTNYFAHPDANPLDLHKACVADEDVQTSAEEWPFSIVGWGVGRFDYQQLKGTRSATLVRVLMVCNILKLVIVFCRLLQRSRAAPSSGRAEAARSPSRRLLKNGYPRSYLGEQQGVTTI